MGEYRARSVTAEAAAGCLGLHSRDDCKFQPRLRRWEASPPLRMAHDAGPRLGQPHRPFVAGIPCYALWLLAGLVVLSVTVIVAEDEIDPRGTGSPRRGTGYHSAR